MPYDLFNDGKVRCCRCSTRVPKEKIGYGDPWPSIIVFLGILLGFLTVTGLATIRGDFYPPLFAGITITVTGMILGTLRWVESEERRREREINPPQETKGGSL
jgi:hypothetical protein